MTVLFSIFFGVMIISLIFSSYMLYRNRLVAKFRLDLLNSIDVGDPQFNIKLALLDKYSYDEMLYSLKPLSLESFYTEDEIKLLKN